jgi:hypothetical protein
MLIETQEVRKHDTSKGGLATDTKQKAIDEIPDNKFKG